MNLFEYKMEKARLDESNLVKDVEEILRRSYLSQWAGWSKYEYMIYAAAYQKFNSISTRKLPEKFKDKVMTQGCKQLGKVTSYEEFIEVYQFTPNLEIYRLHHGTLKHLVDIIKDNPINTKFDINYYIQSSTVDYISWTEDKYRLLMELELINDEESTIVKQLRNSYLADIVDIVNKHTPKLDKVNNASIALTKRI